MYYGHHMGAGWTLIAFAVLLSTLLIAAGLIISRVRRQPFEPPVADPIPEAERVLADRFARGEIDTDEYEQRLHVLRARHR
jgi:putative membrane protein